MLDHIRKICETRESNPKKPKISCKPYLNPVDPICFAPNSTVSHKWTREPDSNRRPPGYEPDELT